MFKNFLYINHIFSLLFFIIVFILNLTKYILRNLKRNQVFSFYERFGADFFQCIRKIDTVHVFTTGEKHRRNNLQS